MLRMRINSSSKPNDITTPRTNQSMDSASCRLDLVFSAALLFFRLHDGLVDTFQNRAVDRGQVRKLSLQQNYSPLQRKKPVPDHFGCIAITSVPVAGQFVAVVNASL